MMRGSLLAQAEHARARGDMGQAERLYAQALASDRSQAALYGAGTFFLGLGRPREAQPLLREAADTSESLAVATALLFCQIRLREWKVAQSTAESLLRLQSSSSQDWLMAGQALVELDMDAQAEVALGRALAYGERSRLCLYGLGFVLHRQGRWADALRYYNEALAKGGDDPGLLSNMAMCEQRLHRYGRASGLLQRAILLADNDVSILSRLVEVSAMRCAFDDESRYAALLDSALCRQSPRGRPDPLVATYAPISAGAVREVFDMAARDALSAALLLKEPARSKRRKGGRLRIGYLSSDLCDHAVGRLFAGYVGEHDRDNVHVHCYSLRRKDDDVAAAIQASVETFRALDGLTAVQVRDAIRDDEIDLLIDLNGYTYGGKPEILASRPASRQVSYLGLIHDHRAPWLDGVILDEVVAPGEMRASFMNDVIDMPGTLFPPAFESRSDQVSGWTRAEIGVDGSCFLMCSFANAYKIDRQVLDCWVEIVRRVDDGVLLLYADHEAASALEEAWARRGGCRERLVCIPRSSRSEYLARLRGCDLMLDTFRYGGGATSVDAIMQGVPVLTLEGMTPVARMGTSLNRFLGMDSLIASDPEDYVARAVKVSRMRENIALHLDEAVSQSGFKQGRRIAATLERLAMNWIGGR